MNDLLPCPRQNEFHTKFKRRRVSAVRDYPRPKKIANVHSRVCSCLVRMYPPPKLRKGVTVMRDFPMKLNVPAALGNHISDPHYSNTTNEMSMAGCTRSDAFDATNVHVCNKAKQDNPLVVRDYKPSDDSLPTSVHDIGWHMGLKEDDSSFPMVIWDEQGHADVPILVNAPAALGNQISDPKGSNVAYEMSMAASPLLEALNASNVHACTDAKEPDGKYCNTVIPAEQGRVGVPIASKDHDCINDKALRPLRANGDEQCPTIASELEDYQVVVFDEDKVKVKPVFEQSGLPMVRNEQCPTIALELDEYQVVVFDEDRVKVKPIAEQSSIPMVSNEQCPNELVEVHDYQVAFGGEDCKKALGLGISIDVVTTSYEERNKVKEVIDHFREVYNRELLQGGSKSKCNLSFKVASLLWNQKKWINTDRRLGPIPGVEVGDYFDLRAEMNIIGLHRQHFNGIDYMEVCGKILATSIVDSGKYVNEVKSSVELQYPDTLIYSGEGENPKVQSKKYIEDQKLKRGNLALKNSSEAKTPVRVIRKISFKVRKVLERKFVYDGLYYVDGFQQEIASSGKLVFKFLIKRFPGQPNFDLAKSVLKRNVCVDDISQGKERVPIRVVNELDDEKPTVFNYITNVIYPKSYPPSVIGGGCGCGCDNECSEDCPCFIMNGGETYNYEECLIMAKPFIVECGPSCKCFISCINRVSQRGVQFPLEIFKTKTRGWGVRSRSFIKCGSFVCEYTGEILCEKESEQRIDDDEYLFDLVDNYGDCSSRDTNPSRSSVVNQCFTIDAAKFGNVGRFINHSCSPNLFPQNVLFDHNNKGMPHIMLFAMEDIRPLQELTYDYNYKVGEICDANGNIKMKPCYCGSGECTGRMY